VDPRDAPSSGGAAASTNESGAEEEWWGEIVEWGEGEEGGGGGRNRLPVRVSRREALNRLLRAKVCLGYRKVRCVLLYYVYIFTRYTLLVTDC